MDLKFEDNSFAQFGSKEVYRAADGEVVVQRPASILLKVQVPVIKTDVAQMTSDGEKFRVAILQDGGSGKFKKFVMGTNDADYSKLQKRLERCQLGATRRKRKRQRLCEPAAAAFYGRDACAADRRRARLHAKHDLSDRRGPER